MPGQECIVERYTKKERCVCVEHCPFFPDAEVFFLSLAVNPLLIEYGILGEGSQISTNQKRGSTVFCF